MKIGVLNIPAPVRMTPCPPRLQLQTLWIGVILRGKMIFWGDESLTKVDHAMKTGVLNIPAPVGMSPCPPRLQLQTLCMGVILTGKMKFFRLLSSLRSSLNTTQLIPHISYKPSC